MPVNFSLNIRDIRARGVPSFVNRQMRTPLPKKQVNQSNVDTKKVDITTGTVRFPRNNKRTGMGPGQLLNGNPVIQNLYTVPSDPSIIERSPENTYVCNVETTPMGAQLELIADAGQRFILVGRQILAGPIPTDYAVATYHTITITAGVGVYAYTKDFIIQVIDVDDGGDGGPTDYIQDETEAFIEDENGSYMWA